MIDATPSWGLNSRFYLPNEDAAVVCMALRLLDRQVRRPVFVGGSGMLLLEAVAGLPELERATFVDIAPFQTGYFQRLVHAIEGAESPDAFRAWFCLSVCPELKNHFLRRGQRYNLGNILAALTEYFGLSFFFDKPAFRRVHAALASIDTVQDDIVSYLMRPGVRHDFIYLSNVPDYLPKRDMETLLQACRAQKAPVYLLLTEACPDQEAVRQAWELAGYVAHPATHELDRHNRGLGSATNHKKWNRPGFIRLLLPGEI